MDKQNLLNCSAFWLPIVLILIPAVSSLGPLKPMPIEYAISRLTQRQREQFVDEHNKYRSLVNPPAANMEYMFWNDDLGNLAQMWANKCIWDHGFLEFGKMYPNAPFKGQVGQNLAREWSRLHNPADRVKLWYQESSNYTFSRFSTSMVPNQCSKPPCKRYTQLVWATTRYVGCGVSFCDKPFAPEKGGETEVVCDYAPGGNVMEQFPYEVGKPCSKCASGKGFCYKNLCRDCDDFDPECGKSLTLAMCPAFKDMMAKKCPKMCNLCECPLVCQNGGKLNPHTCQCTCPQGWKGLDCSEAGKICPLGFFGENCEFQCVDKAGREVCHWRISNGHQCSAADMKEDCAASCGLCGQRPLSRKPSLVLTTPKPVAIQTTAPKPVWLQTTPRPPVHLPVWLQTTPRSPVHVPVTLPSMINVAPGVTIPSSVTSKPSPVAALVQLPNTVTNKLLSISPPLLAPDAKPAESPRIITNKPSGILPVTPSVSLFNVTLEATDDIKGELKQIHSSGKRPEEKLIAHCRDENPLCRLWSAMGKCKKKATWMKKHCCATCKQVVNTPVNIQTLCKDNNVKCPFWASAGECTRDRVWMLPNCRKSCNQCGVCRDTSSKCATLALLDKCISGDKRALMLTHCRQSCGLCQVYDKYDHCSAWAAQNECKSSNWTWMRDNCPLSCRIPLSEVLYCGDKEDGNYAIPRICTGYVTCSRGVTRHELCPNGTLFDPIMRFCDLPENVRCSQDKELTLKKNHIGR